MNKILGFASSALLAVSGAANANLVTNGDFETGSLSGWSTNNLACTGVGTDYSSASGCFGQDTNPGPHGGTQSLYLGNNGAAGLGTISQSIATDAATTYTLSFWLANSTYQEAAAPNEFKVTWNGETLLDLSNVGAFAYTNYTFDVVGAANSSLLAFSDIQSPSAWNLDDVNVGVAVAAVPEPSTYALMLTSLSVVGLVARRRKNSAK